MKYTTTSILSSRSARRVVVVALVVVVAMTFLATLSGDCQPLQFLHKVVVLLLLLPAFRS